MEGAERWMKGVKMRWMRERKEEMMIVMVTWLQDKDLHRHEYEEVGL